MHIFLGSVTDERHLVLLRHLLCDLFIITYLITISVAYFFLNQFSLPMSLVSK